MATPSTGNTVRNPLQFAYEQRPYKISRYSRQTAMTTSHSTLEQTASNPPSWIQQLWQSLTNSIGSSSVNRQTDKQGISPRSACDQAKITAHNPKLSLSPALIGTQTLKAFSDHADEYEPTDLALIELIPAGLALLNIPPTQAKSPSNKEPNKEIVANQADASLIEVANTMTTDKEIDREFDDDDYLMDLIPFELSEISENTLPDLAAF